MLDSGISAASKKVHGLGFFEDHLMQWTPWNTWLE